MVSSAGLGTLQSIQGTGGSCGAATSPVITPGQQEQAGTASQTCASAGKNITCSTMQIDGTQCGTYNGDAVCIGKIPNNTCVGYASGGVACTVPSRTVATSPPAPNTGTVGPVATASGAGQRAP